MISEAIVKHTLEKALESGADFAELFFEDKEEVTIKYENSAVSGIARVQLNGAGLYMISEGKSVYAYTNDLSETSLLKTVKQSAEILGAQANKTTVRDFYRPIVIEPNRVVTFPTQVPYADKIALLNESDLACRSSSLYLKRLGLSYFDTNQRVVIANTEGLWAEDYRVSTKIRFVPFLATEKDTVSYFDDFTRPTGFEAYQNGGHIDHAKSLIKDMEDGLFADEAPSAYIPVILDGGICSGTFFHEACGHQLETNALNSGSIFAGKIGQKIATEKVTLIDDGTLPGMYGSSKFDDEGMPRQKNVLIENGILKTFMSDRLGSIQNRVPRTASGRRQGYCFAPAARMSNTYLAAGPDDDEEMIRSTDKGLFVTGIGGGTGGDEFTLMAKSSYWIKNGMIDRRVKGAMLLGRGDETMLKIDRVGSSVVFEDGGGFCGAGSGLVNTTTCGARMRVEGMIVGGKGGSV